MSGRWPEPVREDLPVALLSSADIDEALALTVRFMAEPEDPAFDPIVFGLLAAARSALIECDEALAMEAQALSGQHGFSREFIQGRLGEALTARRVARKVINELRRWLPEPEAYWTQVRGGEEGF